MSDRRYAGPTPAEYAALFEDDKRGAAILEDLVRRFARQPADGFDGISGILRTYHAQGERRVMDFILSRINQHHTTEPDHEPDQTPTS